MCSSLCFFSGQGMIHALKVIYRQHGILGLWRGSSAAIPRVSIGSATQLSTFSSSKELVVDLKVRKYSFFGFDEDGILPRCKILFYKLSRVCVHVL